MSKKAVEVTFGGQTTYELGTAPYTASALGIGPLITQKTGSQAVENWAGPFPVGIVRPMEFTTAIPGVFPWAMRWSNTVDWIFLADNATAAATRRIMKCTYDRSSHVFGIDGFVTLTYPTTTNHTIRALRMSYELHTTGSIQGPSGATQITGSGTKFITDGACIGNRIGFGTTDPTQITTWYEIASLVSDTGLTLYSPLTASFSTGSSYVIEDLRAITVNTNATTTNGGVFLTKGLRPEIFLPGGYTLTGSMSTDDSRSIYWISDGPTTANTIALGAGLDDKVDFQTQYLYVLDTTTNPTLYKYNIRRPLNVVQSKDTGSLVIKTGLGGLLTGTPTQANNGRIATVAHGPGSGSKCLYFTTGNRIYRTQALDTITTGSTTWIADAAVEVPPGGTSTMALSAVLSSIEYMSVIDRFVVAVTATTTPFRSYVTQYRTDAGQWDRTFGCDSRQIDQSAAEQSSITPHISLTGGYYTIWCEGGVMYCATFGTTAITNRVYSVPLAADWEYTSVTNNRVITPEISTPNCNKYVRAYVNNVRTLGEVTGQSKGFSPEDFRVSYRTTGISDNSGVWTVLNDSGDMSGISGATSIQFMIEFKTIGLLCIPARILSVSIVYEDIETDSHYQFSVGKSDLSTKKFAWRFSTAFASTVPTLRIRLYDAVSGGLLVDDDSATPDGTWEKSTNDGGAWGAYDTTDKGNDTTYIRYTPASLGDNIKVRPILTLA